MLVNVLGSNHNADTGHVGFGNPVQKELQLTTPRNTPFCAVNPCSSNVNDGAELESLLSCGVHNKLSHDHVGCKARLFLFLAVSVYCPLAITQQAAQK